MNALLAHCGTGLHRDRRRTAAGDRAPAGQGHLRRHGRGQDPVGQRQADRRLRRPRPRPGLPRALCWGLPEPLTGEIEGAIGRDKRDRKRMAVVDHGGKFALTRYRIMRAWQTSSRWWNAAWPPAARIKYVFTSRPRAIRWSAIRCIFAASRPSPKPSISHFAANFWTFPDRLCTPPVWASNTPEPGESLTFEAAPAGRYAAPLAATSRAFFTGTVNYTLILTGLFQSCIRPPSKRGMPFLDWGRPDTLPPVWGG